MAERENIAGLDAVGLSERRAGVQAAWGGARRRLTVRRWYIGMVSLMVLLYVAVIAVGMWANDPEKKADRFMWSGGPVGVAPWTAPRMREIPAGPRGDRIRYGALLFDETPLYATKHTHSRMTCANCHAEGGIQPFASPMVGMPALFPMWNERAGHVISLKDRIQECFVRSENGTPLDYEGAEMTALMEYIGWLSEPRPGMRPFVGRGLVDLPELKPDTEHGKAIYTAQCEGCHGRNGEGRAPLFPPVWGPDSFNDGAGMHGVKKMAAFVQHNMPQNRMGILSAQDAFDVAGYIHGQARPVFNPAFKGY